MNNWKDKFLNNVNIEPYKIYDDGILYCGDCLEIMKGILDNSIDLVITDPPYIVGMSSNARKGTQFEGFVIEPYFRDWIIEIKRILKNTGSVYVFCDWRTYPALFRAFCNQMQIANCIIWDYEWIKAGLDYRYTHEFIMYLRNPETPRIKNRTLSDVWRIKPVNFTTKRYINTEKSVEVICRAIQNSSDKDVLILDPFLGSGTTDVACIEMGRRFIGIEINPEYCKIAEKRIAQAYDKKRQMEIPIND